MKEIPNSLLWIFESKDLAGKKYLRDLDFIRSNTAVNFVVISPRNGVHLQNLQQCHGVIGEMTAYAHRIGLKIGLHLVTREGFYNAIFSSGNHPAIDQAQIFPIADPKKAQAITHDIELTLNQNGYARFTHQAIWGRSKIAPIYAEIVKAVLFEKTGDGFYRADSICDVTDQVRIIDARTNLTELEVDLGAEQKGKTVFVVLAQYYNCTAVSDDWESFKQLMDAYSDIPLDGVQMDEYGYVLLNTHKISHGEEPPFRGRMYAKGMKRYYEETYAQDFDQLLFDMRYAPEGREQIRIKAINTYFELLRVFPLTVEKKVYDYAKKIYGEDCYVSCHNTFHNSLENDEIWRTACNWWDIPRDYGHTDENIGFPVRWGLMLACKNPIMFDMYYSPKSETHYDHMIEGAPFNCREFHHAYGDFYWGSSFTEPAFLHNIRKLDRCIAELNSFQTQYPKMDLLVIFGAAAQNNWYPDESARSIWDINGSLHIQQKCDVLWNAGYRCALAPDYAIEDGRISLDGDRISFNGFPFSHCLFLYPEYAKKTTYGFLNDAARNGVKMAVVGKCGIDFDGDIVSLSAPHFEDFDLDILEKINCRKSAIDGGSVYTDGSFSLVSRGILTGEETAFDFTVDGIRYSGSHTGLLAYRKGKAAFATKGSRLFVNGTEAALEEKQYE